jgi:hypothetical protein
MKKKKVPAVASLPAVAAPQKRHSPQPQAHIVGCLTESDLAAALGCSTIRCGAGGSSVPVRQESKAAEPFSIGERTSIPGCVHAYRYQCVRGGTTHEHKEKSPAVG